jgi:hypothetical protein
MSKRLAWLVAAACCALGCQKDETGDLGRPSPCSGDNCGTGPGLATGTTGGAGGAGGATGSTTTAGSGGSGGGSIADASGSVVVLTTTLFNQSALYDGEASISAVDAMGDTVEVEYGGAAGTSFEMTGLPSGVVWFFVQDQSGGGTNVLSTHSAFLLPSSSIQVPVIDRGVLETIGFQQPGFVQLEPNGAHLVIEVVRNGAPLAGVAISSVLNGLIAYDVGNGDYAADAFGTGNDGTIVVLNLPASGLPGYLEFDLVDADNNAYQDLRIDVSSGAATFAGFDLPL